MAKIAIHIPSKVRAAGAWLWSNTESVKNFCQAIALLVVSIVTSEWFVHTELPTLHPRPSAAVSVKAQRIGEGCLVTVNIRIANGGKESFDASKVHLQGWQHDPLSPRGWQKFIDVNEFERPPAIFDLTFDDKNRGQLIRRYDPGEDAMQDVTWFVESTPPGTYTVHVDVEDHGEAVAHARQWQEGLCPE
ncbi:MAG TPA: hypothetical protein VHT28_03370 [Silvibacterium sp.]|nr:hypothetical protein [Silvibacterium sp.]